MDLRSDFCAFLLTCTVLFTSVAIAANTHIQTDGTLSGVTELNINTPGASHLYTLSEINGKLSGHNLFYSFSNFSIGTTDTAWFNLNTADLANVISRVTGGAESIIDGQLKMTNVGNAPSFFFINPAGITFNSGASVDVPGSFYVSTASHLKFSDGIQYAANETNASSLSSANPESFGFLGNETGNINIGSLETSATELTFRPGAEIAFVGNQIYIDNATIKNENFSQAGLDLQLVATGNEATNVKLSALPEQATDGDLITTNTLLNVSGNGSGRVMVHSGNFSASNSDFLVVNTGDIPMENNQGISVYANTIDLRQTDMHTFAIAKGSGGNVTVNADQIEMTHGFIGTSTRGKDFAGNIIGGEGAAGNVFLKANSLVLTDAAIVSNTLSQGEGGFVSIEIKNDLRMIDSDITSDTLSEGNAGSVNLSASSMWMDSGSSVSSSTIENGNAGQITINADELTITNDSFIQGVTLGEGKAGSININSNIFNLNSGGFVTSRSQENAVGHGGSVVINTEHLEMDNGYIGSDALGEGNAGSVIVTSGSLSLKNKSGVTAITIGDFAMSDAGLIIIAAKHIEIDNSFISLGSFNNGRAGRVSLTADFLKLSHGSTIDSSAHSSGDAGSVIVNAGRLEIDDAFISTDTSGSGNAGKVTITAGSLKLSGNGEIESNSLKGAEGNGGKIALNVEQLEINDGKITSSTFTENDAGSVTVTSKAIKLINGGIESGSRAGGNAGSLTINTDSLEMNQAFIFGDTFGNGNAGKIEVNGDTLQLRQNSFISTNTFGSGHAGNISITSNNLIAEGTGISSSAEDLISLERTGIFSGAGTESSGQAGNININSKNTIHLNNGAQISIRNDAIVAENKLNSLSPTAINIETANLFLTDSRIAADSNGNVDAGNINIHFADQLFLDPSQISTEAASGNGGDIRIQGNGAIFLLDSAITTSVSGQSGNGGDIAIAAKGLILDSGFIQANTAASGASGGKVDIQTPALIPSGSSLFVGGNIPLQFQPFSGLNVIQAAAPDGVSGTINAVAPQLI